MTDIVFNPCSGEQALELPKHRRGTLDGWSCKGTSKPGDLYVFWSGKPIHQVVALGVFKGEACPYDNSDGRFDWTTARTVFLGDFEHFVPLERGVGLEAMKSDPRLAGWWRGKPYRGLAKTMLKPPEAIRRLLERIAEENPAARSLCREYARGLVGPRPRAVKAPRAGGAARARAVTKLLSGLSDEEVERAVESVRRMAREKGLRARVLHDWGPACAACGRLLRWDSLYECEVAHVKPVEEGGADSAANALPLCRTHHWAFDRHLWAIRPDGTMAVSATGRAGSDEEEETRKALARELHGKRLRVGLDGTPARRLIGRAYVSHRWAAFVRANGGQ